MAKVVNLDDFANEVRMVTLKGKSYEMREYTVQDYVDAAVVSDIPEDGATNTENQVKMAMKFVGSMFPTMPEELVKGMNIRQLNAIVQLIYGAFSPEADPKEVPEGNSGN